MKPKKYYCLVEYWKGKRRIGSAYVPERSYATSRRNIAKRKGILYYDYITFSGRIPSSTIKHKNMKGIDFGKSIWMNKKDAIIPLTMQFCSKKRIDEYIQKHNLKY